jgi:hypothetical protein
MASRGLPSEHNNHLSISLKDSISVICDKSREVVRIKVGTKNSLASSISFSSFAPPPIDEFVMKFND